MSLPLFPEQLEWLKRIGADVGMAPRHAIEFEPNPERERGKHYVRTAGYAMPPGTGPAEKSCKDCAHCVATHGNSNRFYKCDLCRPNWTNSRRTDILVSAPACSLFEPKVSVEARA
jgi:hypothetical protein